MDTWPKSLSAESKRYLAFESFLSRSFSFKETTCENKYNLYMWWLLNTLIFNVIYAVSFNFDIHLHMTSRNQ